jgi:hypothetical protein
MLWIVFEWWIWGFVALSNIYFVLGLIEVVVAFICLRKACFSIISFEPPCLPVHSAGRVFSGRHKGWRRVDS